MNNAHTAEYLAKIYTPALHGIFLCHLSGDNNHPELAYKTIENRLYEEGIRVGKDVELVALTRNHPLGALYLRGARVAGVIRLGRQRCFCLSISSARVGEQARCVPRCGIPAGWSGRGLRDDFVKGSDRMKWACFFTKIDISRNFF